MIATSINHNHMQWDENRSQIQLAYHTVPHSRIRISPFSLNHGREAIVKHVPKFPENMENFSLTLLLRSNFCP